ncbi:lysylphosphatidylglycerol synthase transmembrane domain-containing protein [Methanothermobacter sp.]|uniref:lysylphosphatidylglycerol synthase transmembrane domain-containing protein n=1 Tax=Methanothermobacter sp. TaxID=1884223 RepID=UPI002612BF31|nr:lysylphosphatidylglycerol synthase transmembrane domain-containing protein [Methanothermobacter sp.]MDI9615634.1 lysylphosphatidylglycerol synthase transmembrane domain-containing protein [Methanothermobacter sp.]
MRRDVLIKGVVSVLILVFLFNIINKEDFLNSMLSIRPVFLLAVLMLPFSIFMRAWRWKMLVEYGDRRISYGDAYGLTLAGLALNIFLPGGMGDIARTYYGYRWHGLKEEMLSTTVLDKVIALLSVFIMGAVAAIWTGMLAVTVVSGLSAILLAIMVFWPGIFPWRRLVNLLNSKTGKILCHEKLSAFYASSTALKFKAILLSFAGWLLSYAQFYIVCLSFGVNVDISYILSIAPIMNLAFVFPFTLNGLGSSDAVVIYFLGLKGVNPSTALLISLFYSQILTSIIPGVFGLFRIIRK